MEITINISTLLLFLIVYFRFINPQKHHKPKDDDQEK